MEKHYCSSCKDEIYEFNENEYFGINYKVYCSLKCFYEEDEGSKEPTADDTRFFKKIVKRYFKAKKRAQTNKSNKRKDKVHKKKSKQTKRKRK